MDTFLQHLVRITTDVYQSKYSQAKAIFLGGSLVRGEGTSTSDLDLVVVFDYLPRAYRESYFHEQYPVEAFVHDPQTLEYVFRHVDRSTGVPSLATMVTEGIAVPRANEFTDSLKQLAISVLDEGPPKWSEQDLNFSRYSITNLIDDLRDPRSTQEMHATATLLYSALANHYCRSRNLWSAKGKSIPKRLHAINSNFSKRFLESFDSVFSNHCPNQVIHLAVELLSEDGGFLFEGFRLEAPESWRIR